MVLLECDSLAVAAFWLSGRACKFLRSEHFRHERKCAIRGLEVEPGGCRVGLIVSVSNSKVMACVVWLSLRHRWHNLCLYRSGEHKARRWKGPKGPTKDWIMFANHRHHQDAGPFRPSQRPDVAWSSANTPAVYTMAQPLLPDDEANWLTLPCTRVTAGFHRSPQSHGSRAIRLTAWGSARSLLPNLPDRQTPPSSALTSSQTSA